MIRGARPFGFLAFLLVAALGCIPTEGKPTGAECTDSSALTYERVGQPFMEAYCVRCHSSTVTGLNRKGAPEDHNFDTLAGVLDAADHIDALAGDGPNARNTIMPPDDPRPTHAERRRLAEWLACERERQLDAGIPSDSSHEH